MSATRRVDSDAYQYAMALARELRGHAAEQIRDLILERQSVGSEGEFIERIRQVGRVGKSLTEAVGRQKQAREMGLPIAPHVAAEREARELLRQAVAHVGETCGAWIAQMDFEERRKTDPLLNGGP